MRRDPLHAAVTASSLFFFLAFQAFADTNPPRPRLEDFSSYTDFVNAMNTWQQKRTNADTAHKPGALSDSDMGKIHAPIKKNASSRSAADSEAIVRHQEDLDEAIKQAQAQAGAQQTTDLPASAPDLHQADPSLLAGSSVAGALDSTAAGKILATLGQFQTQVGTQQDEDQSKQQNQKKDPSPYSQQPTVTTYEIDLSNNSLSAAAIGVHYRPEANAVTITTHP